MTSAEQRWREAELAAEAKQRAKARRQPLILIALIDALVLGIGLTATVDLRRLQTPGGTALRWTQAAVFGDCPDYLEFSVPDRSVPDARTTDELCQDLRSATQQARTDQLKIGLRLAGVHTAGERALVGVVIVRKEVPTRVSMHLVRTGGHWRVVRDSYTCGSVGCP
ncbi:MAG: hypothetical protein ACXVGH_04095 [Mycobacteriales bacterium]